MDKNQQCRTCLAYTNIHYIFNNHGSNDRISISAQIMSIAEISISKDDKLPQYICDVCYVKLNTSFEFKTQCENSDKKLWKLYEKNFHDDKSTEITNENNANTQIENVFVTSDDDCQNNITENSQIIRKTTNTIRKSRRKICKTEKTRPQCSVCGKLVSSEFRLKCHMRVHTGEKPYKCTQCNRQFSLAYNLKIHERIHTGEKPLQCGVCGKCFAQSANLVAHTRLHTGEKPYKCLLCPMSFINCSNLTYHMRMHKGEKKFVCNTCQRAFVQKSDLTQHQRIHTGERLFVCSICGLKLSRNYHLTRHMTTHTGEKHFKCDICTNAYTQKSVLTRHIKKCHLQTTIILKNKANRKNGYSERDPVSS